MTAVSCLVCPNYGETYHKVDVTDTVIETSSTKAFTELDLLGEGTDLSRNGDLKRITGSND